MTDTISHELFERAQRVIPGGVNSPVRAFRSVGGEPIFVREAHGATLIGADGREYVDYVGSWGPMILGHAHPDVVKAIQDAAVRGSSYGAPTEGEITLGELIAELVPSMPMSRLTSSGTEAVMGALRLARGATGRDIVVKCDGGYHGGADYLLVAAGSGAATLGEPDSAGIPRAIAATTAVVPYNDVPALEALFAERGSEIAAVIFEPVAGNMGCVPPEQDWLDALRKLTRDNGALLVCDEVMTGFRVGLGGAQARYGIEPDLTCLGKIVGGGLPVGAYGGSAELMNQVAPMGPVYQAGTLSGNPLAVAAGMKTLELLRAPDVYERLETIGATLQTILEEEAAAAGVPLTVQRVGAMLTPFFTDQPVRNFTDSSACDHAAFRRWHGAMLEAGVHWPPSPYEAGFLSLAHEDDAMAKTRAAAKVAFVAAS